MRYFKLNTTLDLYYKVGAGSIDNAQLKEFANHYNNSFINFFQKEASPQNQSPSQRTCNNYKQPQQTGFWQRQATTGLCDCTLL